MIRIFAPSTRDSFLRPDAVTFTNLVLHGLACVALLVPLGKVAKQELFDRLIVYLVPPDKPGGREKGVGDAAFNTAPVDAGFTKGSAVAHTPTEPEPTLGKAPELDAANISALVDPAPGDNALTVLEVDSAVVRDPTSAAPEYPQHLIDRGIEGSAAVRFVVDTNGVADTMSYRVLKATHADFAVAVRRALPGMKFRPALRGGVKVRQLVEQTFSFKIAARDTTRMPRPTAPPR